MRLSHPPSRSFFYNCCRRRDNEEYDDDELSGSEFEYGEVTFNDGGDEEEEEFYQPREGEEWEEEWEEDWGDGEPEGDEDDNGGADVNTAEKHANRMKQAKEEGAALLGKSVKVHQTTWTVIKEHHEPTRDVCGATKLRGFEFDETWQLFDFLKHLWPGDPGADLDRANAFMV